MDEIDDRENSGDAWTDSRPIDVEITSHAADGFTLSVNGTQVAFRQRKHAPMLAEIYVEDDPDPLGAINTAKGTTAALGGVTENLAANVERITDELAEKGAELERIKHRLNPEGTRDAGELPAAFDVCVHCGSERMEREREVKVSFQQGSDTGVVVQVICPECGQDNMHAPNVGRPDPEEVLRALYQQ